MAFRFRRRLQFFPGISLNLGKTGISCSFGRKGAHVTVGPKGTRTTVGLPGTGMSLTKNQPHQRKAASPPISAAVRQLMNDAITTNSEIAAATHQMITELLKI